MGTHADDLRSEVTDTIRPGDDFYGYVNKKWLDAHLIPNDKARIGAFTEISDENIERLRALLEKSVSHATHASDTGGLARLLYHSIMDEDRIEAEGITPVRSELDAIEAIQNRADLDAYITNQHGNGFSLLWSSSLDVDEKNCNRYVFRIYQAGLGLPDREYYLEPGERFEEIRSKYRSFLRDFFALFAATDPQESAAAVLEIETELARLSSTATELRDVAAQYNPYTPAKLAEAFPGFHWQRYLTSVGYTLKRSVLVSQPKFLAGVVRLLERMPLQAWKQYVLFHSLLPLLPALPKRYELLHFGFYGTVLGGTTEQEPRYRRAISQCMGLLPEPVGRVFTEEYFDESAKAAIYDLVDNIKASLRSRIEHLTWMSSATKRRAFEKLDTFHALLGYPDTWRTYEGLELGDVYVGNVQAIRAYEWRYDMSRLARPVDRTEWLMSPAAVNAYYWSNTNTITFPAGILQPPFFDATGDFAANYGGIGAVIGHEITHGFDDKGSLYDAVGNLHSWWTVKDRTEFEKRTKALAEQYDGYVVDGRKVNGSLTLGENIADLGGLLIAFGALQRKIATDGNREAVQGFTPEQRFFMAWARVWRMNIRPELALRLLVTDPHSPHPLRVNGVLRNVDAFYDAFDVTPDAAGYSTPEQRVHIW